MEICMSFRGNNKEMTKYRKQLDIKDLLHLARDHFVVRIS